jgi:RimJ/RimL family protein N-acetyltransferase
LIGLDGLDPMHDSVELGFLLNERYWGHGYATEAAAVVLWFGFVGLKLNRIYARDLASNTASARVLTRVGMKREGVLREFERKPKGSEDAVMRAILRRGWGPKPGV